MRILKIFGLSQKKKEGIPNIGEKKKREQLEKAGRNNLYIRVAIFLGFLILLIYALPQTSFRPIDSYSVGEPWRGDDLTAPFSFALPKSEAELEAEREQIRAETPLIFHVDEEARLAVDNELISLYNDLQAVLDSYVHWQRAKEDPEMSASVDSLRFMQELELSEVELSDSSWEALLDSYARIYFEDQSQDQFTGHQVRSELENVIDRIMNNGLIDVSKEDIPSNELTVRNLRQRTERSISLATVRDLQEAGDYARMHLSRGFEDEFAQVGMELFDQVIRPNWLYSRNDTQALLDDALSEISRTKGAVAQGQVIVRRGDIITEETAHMLESLAEVRADAASELERWLRFGGDVIVLIVASLFFLFYLYLYRRQIFENTAMFLLVFLTLGAIILGSGLIYEFMDLSPYVVPVAIAPLLLTIIFDSRVGLLAAVTLAIITAVYHDNNFEYIVATIMACGFGVFSVRDINKRTQFFITTPIVVLAGYFLVTSGFALTQFGGWESYLEQLMFIAINSVFILFTYPLILFFEKTFNVTTDFTLLELADTNLPLLKDLMNRAPGTFQHSLQVANMAESAASAIGANALLCRVGALYHDIGKMNKPGYFIENQLGRNEHDNLKPRMSALVIKAHVSDGVKMAEEEDLPELIIDFIRTHHGTSLIRYFYDRAQKLAESPADVREEDFRYDGPIPETKEKAILLLADGVEAASRSMKNPSYTKLENLINRMFEDHLQEGQLNHSPLTFHQIDIIKKTFLNILVGVYHGRVEYPDDEKKGAREGKKVKKEADETGTRQEKQSEVRESDPKPGEAGEEESGTGDAGPPSTISDQ